MEYIYAALLLHKVGKEVSEENVKSVVAATGSEVDDSKIKSLVASLKGVDFASELENASLVSAWVQKLSPAYVYFLAKMIMYLLNQSRYTETFFYLFSLKNQQLLVLLQFHPSQIHYLV